MNYLLDPRNSSQLCSFTITQYACAELAGLTPADLVTVLSCNLHGNNTVSDETWKLFITNVNPILGPALDRFTNMTLPWSRPLVAVLDMIGEVTLSTFSSSNYRNSSFIQRWLQTRLRPFLPYVSPHFLSCLASKGLSCASFQSAVKIFSQQFDAMSSNTDTIIWVDFIQVFLSLNQTGGCSAGMSSSDWLSMNFGPFSAFASLTDLQRLNPNFKPLDVLDRLNLRQLAQVASSPGLLSTPAQVNQLMSYVKDSELYLFFSTLSAALNSQGGQLTGQVQQAFLQQVLNRANLTDPTVPDAQVQVWISANLPPFISAITPAQVPQYFSIVLNRTCQISQQAVALLNSAYSSFSNETQKTIYSQIITTLQVPAPLRCYRTGSFYSFLLSSFMSFQYLTLPDFLSLMPPDRLPELLNSISTAELYSFLSQTSTINIQAQLCTIFTNYQRTAEYLQNQPVVSAAVGRQTLGCVWSRALSASSQDEVDQWFNVRLAQYLPLLSSQLISPTQLSGASCLAFRKFVSVMGSYNYSSVDFTMQDVYNTIQAYLSTGSTPKCYNSSDPVLSSTSWFVDYIGVFITFISLNDMATFGGAALDIFTVDPMNLQLFSQFSVPSNVTELYVQLLYGLNPAFSATLLPPRFRCSAPVTAFTALNSTQALSIVESLNHFCSAIDPTVSSALAQNMGSVTNQSIIALGNSSVGLSTGQISNTPPSVLFSSLIVLRNVVGWSQGQAMAIIRSLLSSGLYKISSSTSLLNLGTLVTGLPSTIFNTIDTSTLVKVIESQSFVTNIISAPTVVQQTIVNQIITVNTSSDAVVNTIPNSMGTLIPRNSLLTLSQSSATVLNLKQWNYEQAMLFFDTVARGVDNESTISFQVLQGFTCTRVQSFEVAKVQRLIKGCRRRGKQKVVLRESQLICMFNYIKTETVTVFTDYPADLLLYYNYSMVDPSLCQAYFSALGYADFSVFSSTLAFKKQILFNNAKDCLRISGTNINQTQLIILGNMTCLLNSTYIQNSDVYVVEMLKLCLDLTSDQSTAVQNVLLTKNTSFGAPVNWTLNTLTSLGFLPLYLSSNFWAYFTVNDKAQFLRTFVPSLKARLVSNSKIASMKSEANKVSKAKTRMIVRAKRDTACTAGDITQVQANDDSFPFGYDVTQFNACLSVQSLKDNLAAISAKAMGSDYQQIILDKLNQAYPTSISDEVLQVLGTASRAGTVTDISKWNITTIDTLSALMTSSDGDWSSDQVSAIVSKYLSVSGKSLGSLELNAIGGTNLCALDLSIINTISYSSLQTANALSLTTCSREKMQAVFSIAQKAFSDTALTKSTRATSTVSANTYQLIMSYLGGADLSYVRTLSASNLSMDLTTFTSLNPTVVNALTVTEVKNLLGTNLPSLKTYENNTVVRSWIGLQLQSALDTLQIGLTGGRATDSTTSTAAASSSSSSSSSNATVTAAATASTAKPSASGLSVHPLTRLQQLLLLAVVMGTMKLMN
uniref:Mesothelin a n=2 Tax=Pygocentrus nattereri TaxID=42514 RepID=A0A3B4EDI9_PYGNA